MKINSFFLCVLSPVFHKMVSGTFREGLQKRLEFGDVEADSFRKIMALVCGLEDIEVASIGDAVELGKLADRFQLTDVVSAIENVILQHLNLEICAELYCASMTSGLVHVEKGCRALLLSRFEDVANTTGFLKMCKSALSCLLDDDNLIAHGEERVFEALIRWMKCGEGPIRGQSLLQKIRFPLMSDDFLLNHVKVRLPQNQYLQALVKEAFLMKQIQSVPSAVADVRLLSPRAHTPRTHAGVDWERHLQVPGRILTGHSGTIRALAQHNGRICCGTSTGTIYVWNTRVAEQEQHEHVMQADINAPIRSMAVWDGQLVAGYEDGKLRAWDLATGLCKRVEETHSISHIQALVVCGNLLVTGCYNGSIKVWSHGDSGNTNGLGDEEETVAAPPLRCEKVMRGHAGAVWSLAEWDGKVVSGSGDRTVRVWNPAMGVGEVVVGECSDWVVGLLVHSRQLFASAMDGTVRVWAVGTWEPLGCFAAAGSQDGPRQYPRSMVGSGRRVVVGMSAGGGEEGAEVCVWDIEKLECEFKLRLPAQQASVEALVAVDNEVWAAAGSDLVVWGR